MGVASSGIDVGCGHRFVLCRGQCGSLLLSWRLEALGGDMAAMVLWICWSWAIVSASDVCVQHSVGLASHPLT